MATNSDEYWSWDPEFRRAITSDEDFECAHAERVARMRFQERAPELIEELCAILERWLKRAEGGNYRDRANHNLRDDQLTDETRRALAKARGESVSA